MTNRRAFTVLQCASVADSARLATLLSSPSAWTGNGQPPDQVAANGSQVELTWFSLNTVPLIGPVSAVAGAKTSKNLGPVTIVHTDLDGKTTSSKQ